MRAVKSVRTSIFTGTVMRAPIMPIVTEKLLTFRGPSLNRGGSLAICSPAEFSNVREHCGEEHCTHTGEPLHSTERRARSLCRNREPEVAIGEASVGSTGENMFERSKLVDSGDRDDTINLSC